MKSLNISKSDAIVCLSIEEVDQLKDILNGGSIETWSYSQKKFAGRLKRALEYEHDE